MENNMLNGSKPLWQQKGGKFGILVLCVLAFLAIINSATILVLLSNTLYAMITLGIIGIILYVASKKETRMAASVGYFVFIRKLIGFIVEMHPDIILERKIMKINQRVELMLKCIGKLVGIKSDREKDIKIKKAKIKEFATVAETYTKKGDTLKATVAQNEMRRQIDLCNMNIEMFNNLSNWITALQKLSDYAQCNAEDATNEVNALRERYKLTNISYTAFSSAMSLMKGDPNEEALFIQAAEKMQDEINAKLGEMDLVLNAAGGMINKADMQKEINSAKNKELLETFNKLGIDGILTNFQSMPSGQKVVLDKVYENKTLALETHQPEVVKSTYFE